MSFGVYSQILNFIYKKISSNSNLKETDLIVIRKNIAKDIKSKFDIDDSVINAIFSRILVPTYNIIKLDFTDGNSCFREYELKYPDIEIPDKYQALAEHFMYLYTLPQPEQRTKEWFDYRYNRITASDTAAAIDQNPYEPVESFICKKCDPNFPFRDNATVFHGKKYEPTATMIYEHIYNNRVFEFGALPSKKYTFLGASPDGICSKYTLDNKFSDRLGTMLEIKCPVTRKITTKGKIAGDICPFYYYCQVQQQLMCCDLDVCDFWQCELSEYTREEYLQDDCQNCINTVGNKGEKIMVDNRLKKGIILEFYPKKFEPEFDGDMIEWKSKYIIPKRLDMTTEQYNNWVIYTMDTFKEEYKDIYENYYFHRIIYWKLKASHNVAIKRDDKFFSSIMPILEDTWEKIKYYREHLDELDKIQKIANERKKYIKPPNTSYKIANEDIIKNKIRFLDIAKNDACESDVDDIDDFGDIKPINKNKTLRKKKQISTPINTYKNKTFKTSYKDD